jgi:F-type H+-transporting ATPase subunit gamma
MASLKIIRKRISSTKSTQKITRAMKMVAGARLTRAQQRITAMRPYAVKTGDVLRAVAQTMRAEGDCEAPHPLLARRPEKKALYLVVSSDRGLCGALNTNVNKATERAWREKESLGVSVSFATLGRKGREYLARRHGVIAQDFPKIFEGLDLDKARLVARWLVPRFVRGEVDSVYIVFSEFCSAITQKPVLAQLLPLGGESDGHAGATEGKNAPSEYLYEPNQGALLERLVPMYLEITLLRAMLDSQASFFGAQMTAMDAATRNAKEMIANLTLMFNRARQAAITTELTEIVSGAEALKD